MSARKPISSASPLLYRMSVLMRRTVRRLGWRFGSEDYALSRSSESLPEKVVEHRSILMRKLRGTDRELQRNKAVSLKLAASAIDGVLIEPGQTFSFWRLVGKPAARRGYLPGLQLSFGEMVAMAGGGLCQFSNLLHWMVLHTPMEVTERHRHSCDPFPDDRRTVPFGTGATVFYNYLDFMFRNGSPRTFQVRTWVDSDHLRGEIRSDGPLEGVYNVEERRHRFVREGDRVFRENQLWRIVTDPATSRVLKEELLMENHAEVRYDVSGIPGLEVEEGG
ncbi:MAG: VanW family protein [Candidatus Aegiribacteria sp.]